MSELSEQGVKDAEQLIESFKKKLSDAAEQAIGNLYTDVLPRHIESDAWTNYREQLRTELEGGLYKSVADTTEGRWARQVREMILHEHREELIKALNQDLLGEIDQLKCELKRAYSARYP